MNAPAPSPGTAAPRGARRTLALAALALCVGTAPALAQTRTTDQADSAAVRAARSARADAPPAGREAWRRVREQVGEFASSPLPDFRYARRLGVAPELARTIDEMARAEGIDPELAFRIIRVESRFDPRAVGPGGASGLMQLMPGTARTIDRSVTRAQLLDARTNLRIGLRYLRTLLDMFDGNVRLAVLAYNRGEGAVQRAMRAGRDPENGYSHRVLGTRSETPYRGPGLVAKSRSGTRGSGRR